MIIYCMKYTEAKDKGNGEKWPISKYTQYFTSKEQFEDVVKKYNEDGHDMSGVTYYRGKVEPFEPEIKLK